jgi:RNA recognition motif-containing protein
LSACHGPGRACTCAAYREDGKPKGFAHVQFANAADAAKALAANGTNLKGRDIAVEAAAPRGAPGSGPSPGGAASAGRSVRCAVC